MTNKSSTELKSEWVLNKHGIWEIRGRDCVIWIGPRPAYCDRGNFLANLMARGELARDLDEQDGWPRYYFNPDCAKLEVEAWLKKRGQWV